MAEDIIKSDFLKRVEEVSKEFSELVEKAKEKDGKHRAIVILASEEVDNKATANIISICGRGQEAFSALHDFAKQPTTSKLFKKSSVHCSLRINH